MASRVALHLSMDPEADQLLSADPFALLVGMLLDQQFPMERAFAGPYVLAQRLGTPQRLDPAAVASHDPVDFVAIMSKPPAVHRFPGSMAARVQALADVVVTQYGADASALWTTASSGRELRERLQALPGFGEQKAKIFLALLGKQLAVRPAGWREAAGPYGEEGSHRSVADVLDVGTLAQVRSYKQEQKRAAKGRADAPGG